MRGTLSRASLLSACLIYGFMVPGRAGEKPLPDETLAQDLKLLQGKWELVHGNDGKGVPSTRSVKEIKGNQETLRRYDVKTGKLTHEHTVDFKLSASGNVRVFTFHAVGGDPKRGQSFVYKVDAENFYDIPGLLHGEPYRNYQETPVVWRWKRVKEGTSPQGTSPTAPEPAPVSAPLPVIPADVQAALQAIDVKLTPGADGYSLDIRRKPGFTDKEIDLILRCPQVVDLTMERVAITDEGLAKLRELPKLRRLILNDCPISADGLKTLAELPLRKSLTSIGLRGTKVKADDLSWLKAFPRLERLDVSQTGVTDASLPTLRMLPLKVLDVTGTPCSAAALDQFQKEKPKLVLKR